MLDSQIVIRNAKKDDWNDFQKIDESGFSDSGIELITRNQFNAWLNIFPKGFFVAEKNGNIGAYVYLQICDFNPLNFSDNRNFDEMTDKGYTIKTHDYRHNCLYGVSVAAIHFGSGRKIIKKTIKLTDRLGKKFYTGVFRMPGLKRYMQKEKKEPTYKNVDSYARLVSDSVKGMRNGKKKYFDPVISLILRLENTNYIRLIKNFLKDSYSFDWGCVIYYENKNFK